MTKFSIAKLASDLGSGRTTLNGQEIAMRALTMSDIDRLLEFYPEPLPPMVKDPNRGSLAPKIPDEDSPEHVRARGAWFKTISALYVIIAANFATEDGLSWDPTLTDDALRLWCEKALVEFTNAVSLQAMYRVAGEVRALGDQPAPADAGLIVELPEGEELDKQQLESAKLPSRYGYTQQMVALQICERFGMNPFSVFDVPADSPGMWRLLRSYHRVREEERASALPL